MASVIVKLEDDHDHVVIMEDDLLPVWSPGSLLSEPLGPGALPNLSQILPLSRARNGRKGCRKLCLGGLTSDWAFRHLKTECFSLSRFLLKPLCMHEPYTSDISWWARKALLGHEFSLGPFLGSCFVQPSSLSHCPFLPITLTFHIKNVGEIEHCLKVTGS